MEHEEFSLEVKNETDSTPSNLSTIIAFGYIKDENVNKQILICHAIKCVLSNFEKEAFLLELALSPTLLDKNENKISFSKGSSQSLKLVHKDETLENESCHICDFPIEQEEETTICHCLKLVHNDCFNGDGDSCPYAKS